MCHHSRWKKVIFVYWIHFHALSLLSLTSLILFVHYHIMWFMTWKWSEWLNSNASYSCNQIITCNVTIFSKTTIIWAFAAICTGAGCMMKDSTFNKVFCCGRNFSNEWNGGYESVIPCFHSIVTSSNFDTKGILIVILQVPISYKAERFCNTSEISKGSILNYDL